MSPPHPLQDPYRGAPLLLVGTTTTADGAVAFNPVFLSLLGDDAAALGTAARGGCCVLAASLVRFTLEQRQCQSSRKNRAWCEPARHVACRTNVRESFS
jgi:hypothetical protein